MRNDDAANQLLGSYSKIQDFREMAMMADLGFIIIIIIFSYKNDYRKVLFKNKLLTSIIF